MTAYMGRITYKKEKYQNGCHLKTKIGPYGPELIWHLG